MIKILWQYPIFGKLKFNKTSDMWEKDLSSLLKEYNDSLMNNTKPADKTEFTKLLESGFLDLATVFRKLRIRCSDSEFQITGEVPLEIITKSSKKSYKLLIG